MSITVEMRSVNSKTADISVRCSSRFAFLEDRIRSLVRSELVRGKIDVSLHITGASDTVLSADFDVLDRVHELFRSVEKRYKLRRTKDLSEYLKAEGTLIHKRLEVDEEILEERVKAVLSEAVSNLKRMRATEGEHLKNDLLEKISKMESLLRTIELARPKMVQDRFDTMKTRIESLLGEKVEEQLILQEVAIFAEKVDIEEEVVRLRTHFKHMRSLIDNDEPKGRQLDFISQELLRETNTIGSKSPDEDIIGVVIELKSHIDRIKEQVQNIL